MTMRMDMTTPDIITGMDIFTKDIITGMDIFTKDTTIMMGMLMKPTMDDTVLFKNMVTRFTDTVTNMEIGYQHGEEYGHHV